MCHPLAACTGDSGGPATEIPAGNGEQRPRTGEVLDFSIRDGQILNRFFRQGPVAAHTVLTSGSAPRLVVAFPAGNSGVSLWFRPASPPVTWRGVDSIRPVSESNRDGDTLYGIQSEITVEATELAVHEAVLSNVRVIRDYLHTRLIPASVQTEAIVDGRTATWYRDRLDGHGGYKLAVEVLDGSIEGGSGAPVVFRAPRNRELRLRVVALTGDEPLSPIGMGDLLTGAAGDDDLAANTLAYLSYREKLLAGSWRFCTYFGRDTLLTLRLLMPVLSGTTIEAGIASVLARLNPGGEVAHEEDIGEFAILRRGADASAEPLYDYKMIDDDFLLAPVAAHYLLDHDAGRERAASFLRLRADTGEMHGDALLRNFRFVLAAARPFAREPSLTRLIRLKEDAHAGDWRDSEEGLGHGRIPYDVNVVFVPAALRAIARLHASGLFDGFALARDDLSGAAAQAETWTNEAPPYFSVSVPYELARRQVVDYAAETGVPDRDALASLADDLGDRDAEVVFNAVALDGQGRAIAVLNSDDGFALLFGDPDAAELERSVTAMLRPFPAGLLTPVGLVVANPVYASPELRPLFSNNHYHGSVVWSWQQALLAAGIARQLRRADLHPSTHALLADAQRRLWQVIDDTNSVRNSELWSWSFAQGEYRLEPFGQRAADRTESNAAQLWSTVYLAIPAP